MKRKRNTGKPVKIGKTRPSWNSEIFYSDKVTRDKKGKKIAESKPKRYLIMAQPETNPTRIRDFEFIRSYTPTPETLEKATARNKNTLFDGDLDQWLEEIETEDKNLDKILKLDNPEFKLKTRKTYAKSVIIAKRKAEIVIRGRVKFRKIKRVETTPPDYETFNVLGGYSYRFYFYNIATRKTVIREIKTNTRARTHPTREINRTLHYQDITIITQDAFNLLFGNETDNPTPTRDITEKLLLPLNKIVQLKPIKTVIYPKEGENLLKPRYRITTLSEEEGKRKYLNRSHAKTYISIDYKQLARAEKRISKKWFKLLTDSLKDETRIIDLTPHLKKLRRKIITSKAITPNTLRSQKPITPRISTVIEYNHDLKQAALNDLNEMRARKHTRKLKVITK